jgi:aldose 1-epimerase
MIKNNFSPIESIKNAKTFGLMPNGVEVFCYTLKNDFGSEFSVINYGATITSLKITNADGQKIDVVLGFENVADYISSFDLPSPPYFGATVGRYAGRINNGAFILNGEQIALDTNHGKHHLHGGEMGFCRVFWEVKSVVLKKNSAITFTYNSQNGEDHFPGNLQVEVTYTLTENNEFKVDYIAKSDEDTIVNLTQHTYFNLEGHQGAITNQKMFVNANKILATNNELIPTGKFENLENHPLNYLEAKNCPTNIDTTYVLDGGIAASLSCEKTKLKMTVLTNQPAVHIYVGGNCFNQITGKENAKYHTTSGICFETQNFPDAPNHDNFPSAVLRKGETYLNNTVFKFENL